MATITQIGMTTIRAFVTNSFFLSDKSRRRMTNLTFIGEISPPIITDVSRKKRVQRGISKKLSFCLHFV